MLIVLGPGLLPQHTHGNQLAQHSLHICFAAYLTGIESLQAWSQLKSCHLTWHFSRVEAWWRQTLLL